MNDSYATAPPPVVVGVDGSEASLAAADLAGLEAARRGLPLEILHAFVLPVMALPGRTVAPDLVPVPPVGPGAGAVGEPEPALREHAEGVLHEAAGRVRAAHPDLSVITRLRDGYPAELLTDASRHASLVVVGHRGTGGFTELLTGSTGIQLANHSAAPVVICRGERPAERDGPVVVGVDGSEGSRRAADFALATAAAHGAVVIAVYAWPVDGAWQPALAQAGEPPPQVPSEVADSLTVIANRYPQVTVHPQVRTGVSAHQALVEASEEARMVVVGSRGRGGFTGLLLGSASQALIHHARSPVAVVGPEAAPL